MRRFKFMLGMIAMILILACMFAVSVSAIDLTTARDSGGNGVYIVDVDDTAVNVKKVPEHSLNYAVVNRIGGKSYKIDGQWGFKPSAVTGVQISGVNTNSTFTFPSSSYIYLRYYGHGIDDKYYNYIEFTEDGRVLYHQNVSLLSINGSERWAEFSGGYRFYFYDSYNQIGAGSGPFICTHLNEESSDNSMFFTIDDGYLKINNVSEKYPTVEDWKDYLKSESSSQNMVSFVYALKTPIVKDVTSEFTFDNTVEVEENDTVTFVNEYGNDVPNTITWYTMPQDCNDGHWYDADDICVVCGLHRPPPFRQALLDNILGGFRGSTNVAKGIANIFNVFVGTGGNLTTIASVAMSLAGFALFVVVVLAFWRKFTK